MNNEQDAKLASLEAKVRELRLDYAQRLPGELARVQSLTQAMEASGGSVESITALQMAIHKLAGAAGSFGFSGLGTKARNLDSLLSNILKVEDPDQRKQGCQSLKPMLLDLVAVAPSSPRPAHGSRDDASLKSQILPLESKPVAGVIWLVEDDELLAQQLALQIGAFGYAVNIFNRFADAEAAATADEPHLLIMDVRFSEENILATEELAKPGRLRDLKCPLLFMSGADDFAARMAAVKLGAAGFHVKPIDVARMVGDIDLLISARYQQPERVLVFDDSAATAALIANKLSIAGMKAIHETDPEKLIDTLASFRPELVLMDLYMPKYTGAELAALIRQYREWMSLPLVYLSGEKDTDKQISALAKGGDDFMVKPIQDDHLFSTVRNRVKRYRQMQALVNRDGLTGLLKHTTIKESAQNEVNRARRTGNPICLVMLDIDHFKSVNDTYGHAAGDLVIAALGRLLRQCLRQSDIVGRYGGEEFLVLLPECDQANALRIMDDIRQRFMSVDFSASGQVFQCRFSAGISCSKTYSGLNADELLKVADEALYQAKRSGRNQVCVAQRSEH